MKIKNLHPWNVPVREAAAIQSRLAAQIIHRGGRKNPQIIAGADISYSRHAAVAYAGVVLLSFPSLKVIGQFTHKTSFTFPYIPGLLSFREAPVLLGLFKTVNPKPDLIFFDGQGYAHPRKFGLACHMGLLLDCPAIGCAKSRLTGHFKEPEKNKESRSDLLNDAEEIIGAAVRSREGCKPIIISTGHKIDLNTAVRRTLQCLTRYRIPEPTRLAHNLANEFRRSESQP